MAVQPPRGWRSDAKLDLKCNKSKNGLKRRLDSAVGCNRWLGGHSQEAYSLSMELSYSLSPPPRVPESQNGFAERILRYFVVRDAVATQHKKKSNQSTNQNSDGSNVEWQ